MPLNNKLKKILVIGSGPIVIGQAAEFDYAGTQACRALKEDGLEVVLVNSNPATIMTDSAMADKIYIEPLNLEVIKRIILKEKPDSLLSTLGGQTGLTLSMQLAKSGFLKENNVILLGANPQTIDKAEDRQLFKDTMQKIGEPVIPSLVVNDLENALKFANESGYPLIIRPAFTLGGTGGGIVQNEAELIETVNNGLRMSPINQVLVEKCISGWKEIEFEVVRDSIGNVITVCSMENFDPVGVHTGDSIVIAPAVTLSDKEYQMLRTASLNIINELGVEGGCNCQFALHPDSFEYAVIEVNPRVSRSSALASKATGYPIARIATKIAIGYTLGEIKNEITGKTFACFEPALDYVVVKLPRFPFDKFVYAKRELGTQMKATGEVMAIGATFEEALMKAVRGAEISQDSLNNKKFAALPDDEVFDKLAICSDERLFVVFENLKRGIAKEKIFDITKIDNWFLSKMLNLVELEKTLKYNVLDDKLYLKAKKYGYLDTTIERISGQTIKNKIYAGYKMVDTCAAEFSASTPYFYSSYEKENEALDFIKNNNKTIIVFGSGPIRIGQGIEFDYSSVHCVWALKNLGYEVVIVNNNPETVSTDYDTADRLYFEPLTNEDVMNVINTEKPFGVVVAFGGQTAIKLTKFLQNAGINIIGTSADSIDIAEDRERFDALLESLSIKRPEGYTVMTKEEAISIANRIGYPVLIRPSYVLGGQNMIIAWTDADILEYLEIILSQKIENPILIDKYLSGIEIEVDAICDGEDILIPGIMEHIERAGIHSGDSIAVYPAYNINITMTNKIIEQTKKLSMALKVRGLVNIQYLVYENELYVIEVNPRSSRTVPYISKVTKVPMIDLATRTSLGEKLKDLGFGVGLFKKSPYVAVKVPVFSFEKLIGVDNHLGPEMKSTGEVLGIGSCIEEALYKGLLGAGYNLSKKGGVLITVRDTDKGEIVEIAKQFYDLGFELYATKGTANLLNNAGLTTSVVNKIHECNVDNTLSLIESGKLAYVISTSTKGRIPTRDSVKIRRLAVERSIPCLTSLDTANAICNSIRSSYSTLSIELVDINNMRAEKMKMNFTKMNGLGNDYIYFNCFNQEITNPEALAIRLSNRHFSIGGDGVVLICPSEIADAKMRMFNLDGSEGKMCGNAIRCVSKYLYDNKIVDSTSITVETLSGIKYIEVDVLDGLAVSATVNMGSAMVMNIEECTMQSDDDGFLINKPLEILGKAYGITTVSMGNPHCVVFLDDIDNLDIQKIGVEFENHSIFPQRVNTEFVKIINKTTIKMRVWERGSGETLACGTGACAAAVASVLNGYCNKNEEITVKLLGGDLKIKYTDDAVFMTGNAEKSFEGVVEI
jgi:carbamoyl-phosphate synthase large subunit